MAKSAIRSKERVVQHDVAGLEPATGGIEDAGVLPPTPVPGQSPDSPSRPVAETAGREEAVDEGADRDGPGLCRLTGDRVDVLEAWAEGSDDADVPISLVRIDEDETPVIPFTSEGSMVRLHYCKEAAIQGYVQCNGSDCLLCRIGRKQEERLLLPVYTPASRSVGALAISPSSRPGALRPQLMPSLRSGRRVVWLIRRVDRIAFHVAPVDLREDIDDGAEIIADFVRRWTAGRIDLKAVYQRLDDRDLAEVAGVAEMMKIKGIEL